MYVTYTHILYYVHSCSTCPLVRPWKAWFNQIRQGPVDEGLARDFINALRAEYVQNQAGAQKNTGGRCPKFNTMYGVRHGGRWEFG